MAGVPGQPGRAVPEGLDRRRAARPPRAADHPAAARPGDRQLRPGVAGTRRSTWSRTGCVALRARARRRTPSRSSAAAGSPTRRPTSSASSPGSRCGTARSTTTAGSACRRPRRPATAPSAWTAGCRSRSRTSSGPTCCCWSAPTSAETMPPAVRHLDAQRERGGRLIVVDPRRDRRPPSAPTCACSPCPGTDLALALGLLHLLIAGGLVDEEYVAARTTGFDGGAPGGRRLVAGAGRAGHRRAGRRELRALVRLLGDAPTGRSSSPRAAPSSTPRAPTPCSP